MTKRDGRRNNGARDQGLEEAQVLVTGPRELIEGMRARAEAEGLTVRGAWRSAAKMWLDGVEVVAVTREKP